MADSPYFDRTYFDPTYFDDNAASGGRGGGRVVLPLDDELAVALLLALEDEF